MPTSSSATLPSDVAPTAAADLFAVAGFTLPASASDLSVRLIDHPPYEDVSVTTFRAPRADAIAMFEATGYTVVQLASVELGRRRDHGRLHPARGQLVRHARYRDHALLRQHLQPGPRTRDGPDLLHPLQVAGIITPPLDRRQDPVDRCHALHAVATAALIGLLSTGCSPSGERTQTPQPSPTTPTVPADVATIAAGSAFTAAGLTLPAGATTSPSSRPISRRT
ncbi:hypothetical protein [Cellulomonas soli]